MRRPRLFIIVAGLTLLLVISIAGIINIQEVNLIKPSTFLAFDKYENNAYGINIEYPHSWEKVDFSGGGLVVGFVSNDRQESGLPENVVIQTTESKFYNGISPMELAMRAIIVYKSHLPNFSLLNSTPYTIPTGLSVYKIEYAHTSHDLKIITLEVWIVNGEGDHLYRIIFSADNTEYSNLKQTVDKIIDSFTLKHAAPQSTLTHI